jgi:hypothetical protein
LISSAIAFLPIIAAVFAWKDEVTTRFCVIGKLTFEELAVRVYPNRLPSVVQNVLGLFRSPISFERLPAAVVVFEPFVDKWAERGILIEP